MSVLRRLGHQKKQVVWGIRAPKNVRLRWQMLATLMRIPTNRLVIYALRDWMRRNRDVLADVTGRNRLADRITEAYLKKQLN